MSAGTCPLCDRVMVRRGRDWNDRGRTRDHILQKSRGGGNARHNIRIICRRCNEVLGAFGNCIGAVAAMRAVIGNPPLRECLIWWRAQRREAMHREAYRATKPDRWCAPANQERGS